MKKILLSCACCLLAVGLLAGCDEDVEDVTPEDPNAGVVAPSGDDGGSTESGPVVVKTGKLGFLQENKGAYYYFTGELNSSGYGVCSTDFSEGADVTVSKEEDSYYLSIEVESETLYLSCPDTEHSAMELSKEPYALVYNEEFDTFTTVDDTKFIGTYGTFETLCWANLYFNGESNLGADGEFCASVFTSAQTIPEEEPVELSEGAYRLGVADTREETYRWFTGISSSAGQTTTSWNSGTDIYIEANTNETTGGYAIYYLYGESKDYIAWSSSTSIKYQTTAYYWAYDESSGAFIDSIEGNSPSGRFLGLQNGYDTLKAFAISNLPSETNPYSYCVASLYSEAPEDLHSLKLPDVEVPNLEVATSITDGGEYYLGYDTEGARGLAMFNGTQYNTYELYVSYEEVANVWVKVKATSVSDTEGGYTLTFEDSTNTEQTIYGYTNSNNVRLAFGASTDISTNSGVSTFYFNSDHSGLTITLSETEYYVGVDGSYANELSLYATATATNTWCHLYSVVSGD